MRRAPINHVWKQQSTSLTCVALIDSNRKPQQCWVGSQGQLQPMWTNETGSMIEELYSHLRANHDNYRSQCDLESFFFYLTLPVLSVWEKEMEHGRWELKNFE